MRRVIATTIAVAALSVLPAPAYAAPTVATGDEPYNCELLLADTQDRLSTSIALNYGLNVQVDQLTEQRDHLAARVGGLTARVDRLVDRVHRKQARIDRLRARLAVAR